MMIKRIITDEIKTEAMRFAKEITEASINCTHKFGNDGINQHYIGRIGELIFKGWLVEYHIKGVNPNKADGCSDKYDFMLEGSDKTIDVKAGQRMWDIYKIKPEYSCFITEKQIPKSMDYYVNVQLDKDLQFGYMMGYISRDDVISNYNLTESIKYPNIYNYNVNYEDLGDIRELIFKETGKLIDGYEKPTSKQYSMMDY